jgi:hypothetical protein
VTYVSTPDSGALPRRRVFKPGSLGAITLVVVMGAAIAGGIAVSNDEAQPAAATVSPSGETFTQQREGGGSNPAASADRAHLNRGTDLARQGVLAPTVPGQPG